MPLSRITLSITDTSMYVHDILTNPPLLSTQQSFSGLMKNLADIAVAVLSKHPFSECLQASPHHQARFGVCSLLPTTSS